MKVTDTVSVLVCVHSVDGDHDYLLTRALDSLVNQTDGNFEVVIILDECWQATRRIIESYKDVLNLRFFERQKKQGLAFAKNYGLTKCTGDWIMYLDADDQWIDSKFEVQRKWMIENPDVDICATNAWDLNEGYMYPNCFSVLDYMNHEDIAAVISRENVICHGSVAIRTSLLDRIGFYNTDTLLLGREDWELWQRAVAQGAKFSKIPERLYVYTLGTSVPR